MRGRPCGSIQGSTGYYSLNSCGTPPDTNLGKTHARVMNVNSFSAGSPVRFTILQNLELKIMENYAFFIGTDISKETLDFALIVNNTVQFHVQVSNDKKGIEQFIKQAKKQNKTFSFTNSLFCMEHTGICRIGEPSLYLQYDSVCIKIGSRRNGNNM